MAQCNLNLIKSSWHSVWLLQGTNMLLTT